MTAPSARTGRDLPRAVVVGLGLVVLLAASLLGPPWALTALVLVLLVAAVLELARVLAPLGRPVDADVLVVAAVVTLLGTHLAGARGQVLGLTVLVLGALLRPLARSARVDVVGRAGRTTLLGLWLPGLGSFAVLTRALPDGVVALTGIVLAVALADTAAYLVGSRLGRRRIAPDISPHKTWEGLAAGLAAAALGGALVLPAVAGVGGPGSGALLGLAIGLAAFLGDLVESLVKRDLGVKDLGRLLPGHGGVIDRVDGLLFALPVGHLLLATVAGGA